MIVLLVLLVTFGIALVALKLITRVWNPYLSGCIAMCAMLCFAALGHFLYPAGMEMMMPSFIPFKKGLVFITGLLEIAGGIGLLFQHYRRTAALLLIIFFILVLPANIYAALHHINYQTATTGGPGPEYLWLRVPMQLVFIAWVWFFGWRRGR
ncbi:DoxX family protein [Chitinophaga alhagiae]|uniref:DoxX family protein n=1 Tax=Chitinophaga alhagiae TaxID=2203219 RepID=UPI000E5B3E77|nr:hypothetical protein [Chitinophaga alhagiae]